MNKSKAKERYYAVRVSKGPFCPVDLFQDIWDKIKKQHEHCYASFATDSSDYFEIGNYSDGSNLMTPELLLSCVKGNVDDVTNHRHLSGLLNYEVVWYNNKEQSCITVLNAVCQTFTEKYQSVIGREFFLVCILTSGENGIAYLYPSGISKTQISGQKHGSHNTVTKNGGKKCRRRAT